MNTTQGDDPAIQHEEANPLPNPSRWPPRLKALSFVAAVLLLVSAFIFAISHFLQVRSGPLILCFNALWLIVWLDRWRTNIRFNAIGAPERRMRTLIFCALGFSIISVVYLLGVKTGGKMEADQNRKYLNSIIEPPDVTRPESPGRN